MHWEHGTVVVTIDKTFEENLEMELGQLKHFVTIADTRSFTKAAELLHLSQPALSYQIRRLETELGTRLFDRGPRRVTCTADGELFLPLAQAVLFLADEAVRVLREHLGVEAGEVRLGANDSVSTYLLPGILASFRRNFPRVRVQLYEGGDLQLEHRVLDGTIDFAIVTAPGSPSTLEITPLFPEELLLILAPSHRYATRSTIALRELAYEQFVFPTHAYNVVSQLVEACRLVGFEPKVSYQTGSLESVKGFVRQGLGVAVLPRMAVTGPGSVEALVTLHLQEHLTRSLNLIRGKDRSMPAAAQALMIHVRETLMNGATEASPAAGGAA